MASKAHGDWHRVTKAMPCPVCGKPDWCLVAGPEDNPTAAICQRIESDNRRGDGGWLHRLRDDRGGDWRPGWQRRMVPIPQPQVINFDAMAAALAKALSPEARDRLATSLGLTGESLRRLGVGWCGSRRASTWPMRSADGRVTGLRLRFLDGKKSSATGSRDGLFFDPDGLTAGERLDVTEGASDCAALLDVGMSACGRPSAGGGLSILRALAMRLRPSMIVLWADRDQVGKRSAEAAADELLAIAPVRIAEAAEGFKDARAWKSAGAVRLDFEQATEAAMERRLVVKGRKAGMAS